MDSRQVFDLLIYIVIGVGLILAAIRLYQDFTRPLPDEDAELFGIGSAEEPTEEGKNHA